MNKKRIYRKFNWLSIFMIFMLFVIGGLVRSTGSGMGCPDWPKCFGEYVPPTSIDDLPENYEDFFTEQRIKKNERLVLLLQKIGLEEQARKIQHSKQITQHHEFNVTKAYVEYFNRLWGAATGLIVFLCFILSFGYWKTDKRIVWYTLLGFIAVFVNAFLGAIVVNSNLLGNIVTLHFIAAFASICFFIIARHYTGTSNEYIGNKTFKITASILMLCTFTQIVLGAETRELYDLLAPQLDLTEKTSALQPTLQTHILLGVIILTLCIYQIIVSPKGTANGRYSLYILFLSVAQLVWGPLSLIDGTAAISKLFHISLGAGIFVLQFYICTSFLRVDKIIKK